MRYDTILGLEHIKNHLHTTVSNGRVAHAQLFVGPTGSGVLPLAIAYARDVLCNNSPDRCDLQMDQLAHPDLHFSYPVANNTRIKDKATSDDFLAEWRQFLKEQPYGSLADWYPYIDIEKKQSNISVHEAKKIVSKLSLKSYEGGYKILIIWGADKLNTEASNKLLKLIEEPPAKTLFILITEDADQIINTIKSRCQVLDIPKLSADAIAQGLVSKNSIDPSKAAFLNYCLEYFRQAMLLNYKATPVVYLESQVEGFELAKFAPFIDGHRITDIMKAIEDAIYHIERNGNGKVILTDLSIQLTRLLHKKAISTN